MGENKLKEFREAMGLSQVTLSYMTHIASPNLSAIENGRLAPWPKARRKLARALNVTVEELFPSEVVKAVTSGN